MHINADFAQRVAVHAASLPWQASPEPGVQRRMLDRIGEEIARATSIVRYAPGSRFAAHTHELGEEFLVLAGVFQDEHGDYPAGAYVRNPPHTRHTPGSAAGCTLFVKLRQFDVADRLSVRIDTRALTLAQDAERAGVRGVMLHRHAHEEVRLEHWQARAQVRFDAAGGLELLVLEGGFVERTGGERFVQHSWLRLPPGDSLRAQASEEGCRLWIKRGHLIATRS